MVSCAGIRFSDTVSNLSGVATIAAACNALQQTLQAVTLQHRFSSFQHRASLEAGAAALHIHCSRSIKFLTQGQVTRSPDVWSMNRENETRMGFIYDFLYQQSG